jgi:hypothetical protein
MISSFIEQACFAADTRRPLSADPIGELVSKVFWRSRRIFSMSAGVRQKRYYDHRCQ